MAKNRFYAVVKGRKPGIYRQWFGENGAEIQVRGFSGAVYKGFPTEIEAQRWMEQKLALASNPANSALEAKQEQLPPALPIVARNAPAPQSQVKSSSRQRPNIEKNYVIYTDGACKNNPGNGGYGVVILHDGRRAEYYGGYAQTTNNRMELMACIVGLEHVPTGSKVTLYSDSTYVVNGIQKGWAKRWRSRGWLKSDGKPAENSDLWARLLDLCEKNSVNFIWLRGHVGDIENERCNTLAQMAATLPNNPPDPGYHR